MDGYIDEHFRILREALVENHECFPEMHSWFMESGGFEEALTLQVRDMWYMEDLIRHVPRLEARVDARLKAAMQAAEELEEMGYLPSHHVG